MSGMSSLSASPSPSSSVSDTTIGVIITLFEEDDVEKLSHAHSSTGSKLPTVGALPHSSRGASVPPGKAWSGHDAVSVSTVPVSVSTVSVSVSIGTAVSPGSNTGSSSLPFRS